MTSVSLLQQVRILAQTIGPDDELFFDKSGALTSKPFLKAPSQVKRIIDMTTSFFQRLSIYSRAEKEPLKKAPNEVEDLSSTIHSLEKIFGSKRLKRNVELVCSYTRKGSKTEKNFSKTEFATLLFCLSLITKEDVTDLLFELQSSSQDVHGLTGETLERLRLQFSGKTLDACSKEDIFSLEKILLPFDSVENLFWKDASHTQYDKKAPSTFPEMMERAAWARFLLRSYPLAVDEWEYLFTKAFAPPFLPDQIVVPHPNGYLYMSHSMDEGGAGKRFFAQLGSSPVDPIVLYQSTRGLMPTDSRQSAFESFSENLRRKLGSLGPIRTYEKTKALLDKPELGFVRNSDQKILLLGYSLGGAQAQRDTLIYLHRIKKLVAVSAPGIDHDTAALFRDLIVRKKEPLSIVYTLDAGDFIPFVGEEHLWAKENASVTIKTFAPIQGAFENLAKKNAFWEALDIFHVFQKCQAASQAHSRLTVAAPYYRQKELETTSEETFRFCQHDPSMINPSWEWVRKLGCIFGSQDFTLFARAHSTEAGKE